MYLFVYGTLKEGYGNNSFLQGSTLLGNGKTVDKYYMWDVGYPHVFTEPVYKDQECFPLFGEVYEVDDEVLMECDGLEGVDYNHYYRKEVEIETDDGKLPCFMYITHNQNKPCLARLTDEAIDMNEQHVVENKMWEWGR